MPTPAVDKASADNASVDNGSVDNTAVDNTSVDTALVGRPRGRLSLVWLVPLIAAIIGATLVVRHLLDTGPQITIDFRTAEGLSAGRTEVRYKDVTIGMVSGIALTSSADRVSVSVQLDKHAAQFAADDTRFWVVRPRIGVGGISGLGTLVAGAHVAVDRGESAKTARHFTGLESPPLVMRSDSGRTVRLRAADLGSLDIGSPVYYRNLKAGRVVGYGLATNGAFVDLQIFIDSPYDWLITPDTRFWNASGLDFSVNASGVKVDSQSLATIVAGGIAFGLASREGATRRTIGAPATLVPAPTDAVFELFGDEQQAFAPPDGLPVALQMTFHGMVRGLAVGAQVEFMGVAIGAVTAVRLSAEPDASRGFPVIVTAEVFPARLGSVRNQLVESIGANENRDLRIIKTFVEQGMRAQLRTGNLLTGQLYVSLDFHPEEVAIAPPLPAAGAPFVIPTIASTFEQLEPQVAQIVERLNKLEIDKIGSTLIATMNELQETLKDGRRTVRSADTTLAGVDGAVRSLSAQAKLTLRELSGETQQTLASLRATIDDARRNLLASDAPTQRNLNETMVQVQRASQSLRVLSDYLQQNPESLLRGKPADQPLK